MLFTFLNIYSNKNNHSEKPHTQPAQHGNASSCCYQSPGIPEADKDTLVFCQHEEAVTVNTNLHKDLQATITR